jgi:hypothetical protein
VSGDRNTNKKGLSFISNRQRRKEGTFCAVELAGIEPTPAHSRRAGYACLSLSATGGIDNDCFAIVVLEATPENSIDCEIRITKQCLFCHQKKKIYFPALPRNGGLLLSANSGVEFHNEDMTWRHP